MNRFFLSTPEDIWFDADKASYYNGSNHISRLYLTASGRWVLNEWSQWQGKLETYEAISQEHAILWLMRNEHEEEAEKYNLD